MKPQSETRNPLPKSSDILGWTGPLCWQEVEKVGKKRGGGVGGGPNFTVSAPLNTGINTKCRIYSILCRVYSVGRKRPAVPSAIGRSLGSPPCPRLTQYTLGCTLNTVHSTLYTLHYVLCTVGCTRVPRAPSQLGQVHCPQLSSPAFPTQEWVDSTAPTVSSDQLHLAQQPSQQTFHCLLT